jgi:hypothetical protein
LNILRNKGKFNIRIIVIGEGAVSIWHSPNLCNFINKKGNYHDDLAEPRQYQSWFDYYDRCRLAEDERSGRSFALIVQKVTKRSIWNCHIAGLQLSSKLEYKTIWTNAFICRLMRYC